MDRQPPEVHCAPGTVYVCRECDFVDERPHLFCPHCGHGLMVPEAVVLHRAASGNRVFMATKGA